MVTWAIVPVRPVMQVRAIRRRACSSHSHYRRARGRPRYTRLFLCRRPRASMAQVAYNMNELAVSASIF